MAKKRKKKRSPKGPKPPVDFAQLRAFVFCRSVKFEDSGVTVIGIHDNRFAKVYPAQFDELRAYLSFQSLEIRPLACEIFQKKQPDGPMESIGVNYTTPDESGVILTELNFSNVVFPEPGIYSFALYVEGLLIGTSSIAITDMGSN